MPLKSGNSKAVISANIKELVKSKASVSRSKAIDTIAKKRGITKAQSKQKQAVAIAINKSSKRRKK